MGILTENDIKLIHQQAKQIEYGTVEIEFRGGECYAVVHKGRVLTDKGKASLKNKKKFN